MNAQKYGDDFFVVSFEGKNALDEFLIHMHFFFKVRKKGEKGTKIEKKSEAFFRLVFWYWKNWELLEVVYIM